MVRLLSIFYRLPRLTALAMLVMLIGGLGAMFTLGRQEDPTLIERYGSVVTFLPGADAERMEALITEPLEAALMELPEIDELESSSRAGVSTRKGQRKSPGTSNSILPAAGSNTRWATASASSQKTNLVSSTRSSRCLAPRM